MYVTKRKTVGFVMPINQNEIQKQLKRILDSNTFSKSTTSGQLLSFLVENSMANRPLKEFIIGEEFFKKPDDGRTRVYVHNLRKKLNSYYQAEGANDLVRFTIPKGQYNIQFLENKQLGDRANKLSGKTLVYILFAIIFSVSSIYLIKRNSEKSRLQNSLIWKNFLKNDEATILVLGDHFFFTGELPTGGEGMLRSAQINSEEDLERYLNENNFDEYRKLNYTYLTRSGPICLFNLLPFFKSHENLIIRFSSDLTYEDVRNNNIIYFGSFKSIGLLSSIFNNDYYSYIVDGSTVIYNDSKTDSIYYYSTSNNANGLIEYPVVIKTTTSYGKDVIGFMCINDAGNTATLNYFLQPDSIKNFAEKIPLTRKSSDFKSLFSVKSLDRTDMSIQHLHGEPIK